MYLRKYIKSERECVMRNRRKAVRLLSAAMLACVLALGAAPLAFAEPDDETYTEEPTYEEPTYEEPTYEEPTYEEPTYEEPTYEESTYEEPTTEEPTYEEPTYEEPTYEEPTTEEPTYEEPTYEDPGTEEPAYEEPAYTEPEHPEYYTPETTFDDTGSYENTWDQSYTLDQDNATSELSTDVSVDTSELTKSDWDELQKALTKKNETVSQSANLDAKAFAEVKKNRDDGSSHNDVWIFLVTGIPLLVVGAALITTVIVIQVRASAARKAAETIDLHTAPAAKNTASAQQTKSAAQQPKAPPALKPKRDKDLGDTLSEPLDFKGADKKGK